MKDVSEAIAWRLSELGTRVRREEPVITHLMSEALSRPGILSLAAGFTDNSILPAEVIEASVQRIRAKEPESAYLQYGINQGRVGLRRAVLKWLSGYPGEAGISEAQGIENVLITNGSQQALYLTAQYLCDPGDIVLVESPSYFVFLELLKGLGLRPVSIPTGDDGRVDFEGLKGLFGELEASGELERVKLLYFMGVYANPSSRSWEEADKKTLGQIIRGLPISLPVVEDAAYRELYFEAPWRGRSLLSLEAWEGLPYLYAGTFTKPFATGLKVGFVVSPEGEWIQNLARIKGHQDFGTSNFTQAILEDVVNEGEYGAYLKEVRPHYGAKMKVLDTALKAQGLAELGWRWEIPEGGLLLWAEAPEGWDTSIGSVFCEACLRHGVLYVPGDLCFAENEPKNCVRLSFGVLNTSELEEAARRFVAAVREMI